MYELHTMEKGVWDCTEENFYKVKQYLATIINNNVDEYKSEIENLKSLDILCIGDLMRYSKEMHTLQTDVSNTFISLFNDLEFLLNRDFTDTSNVQICIDWTGNQFMQNLYYDIFNRLNLDYCPDILKNLMFIRPKFHRVIAYVRENPFGGLISENL